MLRSLARGAAAALALLLACASPTLGKVIGLAVLSTDVAHEGETVEVAVENGSVPATVAPTPLYDTEKKRPRA